MEPEVQDLVAHDRHSDIVLSPRLVRVGLLLVLLLFSYILLFYRLGDRDLLSSHEARAAQDAETILVDNRWALPALFDRKIELQKPPLYYWMVAAAGWLRGGHVDASAVRLPAAFAALAGAVSLYYFGVLRGRMWAGAITALALMTMLHYTWLGRVGRIDMPLSFAVTIALTGFCLGHRLSVEREGQGAWKWFLAAYFGMGLGVLLKGPIGIVLPASVIFVFLLLERELPAPWRVREVLQFIGRYWLGWGTILVAFIAGPWFLWANVETDGAFFDVFFWKHNVERGLGGGSLAAHPWWFYGLRAAIDPAPWSLGLPVLAWLFFRRSWWRSDLEARFGLVWFTVMLLVLSLSRFKRADYLLPAYAGAALFIGTNIERFCTHSPKKRLALGTIGVVVISYVFGWWLYLGWVQPAHAAGHHEKGFAAEIRRRAPAPQLILFFRTEDHVLAFHVGRPIDTILEWENLDYWVGRPEIYHVVMPAEYADQCSQFLKSGRLKEVIRSAIPGGSTHSDPLVLLRTHPESESPVP
jgi:4-amino-4-deoxy-L-arabinose transferase-like glycosyltransferase